jgi:hypothetical protein
VDNERRVVSHQELAMHRTSPRAGLAAIAVLLTSYAVPSGEVAVRAADTRWLHRIVSGYVPVEREFGFDLERRMNDLGAQGFRLATVVQPRPPLLAEEATVILAKDNDAPVKAVQFAILSAATALELQKDAASRAADGFAVVAVTVTQGQQQPMTRRGDAIRFYDLAQHSLRYVALLERVPTQKPRPARIVEATTKEGGWDEFIAATRASFRVTQSTWLGPQTTHRLRERILFLMHDDGTAAAYETAVPATSPRTLLADHIEKYEKRGFEVEAVWSMLDRAEVLFIKPVGRRAAVTGTPFNATTWNLDETLDVFGTGRFVGGGYAREEGKLVRHFVQDRRVTGYQYEGVTGVFPRSLDDRGQLGGVGFVGFGPAPETEQTCAPCVALHERGQEGYRAVWAAVGPGYKFERRMEIVVERHRP